MMTVMLRGRRARRQQGMRVNEGTWTPGGMSGGTLKSDGIATVEPAPGSAKPGRGGRRKRRRRAAIRRDMQARCRHLDAMRSLPKEQRRRFVYRARFRRWIMRDLDRVWNEGPGLTPPPGRRERRRRAKLRRRRELNKIRCAARALMLTRPQYRLYQSTKPRWFWRELKRISRGKIEQAQRGRSSPTPGA
jgi:hypothetical protein